jgi:phosphohistidine phosphatase
MNRHLILMRHGKSSWDDPGLCDHDRPLNPRGFRASRLMGRFLAAQHWLPEVVLCSTAQRTRSTWDEVTDEVSWAGHRIDCEDLYLASPQMILDTIQDLGGDAHAVLVLGHNPGMEQLLEAWIDYCGKFPTAAVAVLQFTISAWGELALDFKPVESSVWKPKELESLES